jgi:2-succinyl-5-enolpyruvyl-6-hydroxy-3-cyclohexene-1-carboxylate synthase
VDPANRNTALASALVEELARCGVRRAAVSPGSRSTPLALALWRQPSIDVEVILDERSAGFFALGTALATGVPAAVLCTSGSAAANLHPAVVEADEAGVPLIVLTADRPPELRDIGAGQTIDQLKLYGDSPRWFCDVGTHEADDAGLLHLRAVGCRAYAAASGDPRPGPVHLNLAWREPLAPIPVDGDVTATDPLALEGRGERPLNAVTSAPAQPEEALLDELAERLGASPRGLIVAGRQSHRALAAAATELAFASGYPILAEPTSQLRRGPHERSLVVSSYDLIARERPAELTPELIVRVGDMPTSKALRQWLGAIPGLEQIVVDPVADWREPTRTAGMIVRADPGPTLGQLARRLGDSNVGHADWSQAWLQADAAAAAAVSEQLGAVSELSEPGAWLALGGVLRDGDQVFAASSMPVRDLEAFLPGGPEQVTFHSNRGANGIDGLVSTASGLAAAGGGRTWAVLGDLALAHDMGGLAAARSVPGLRLLVLDNGGGGIFHFLPVADAVTDEEFEALLGTPSGLDLARAAELYGLSADVVETPAELDAALAGDARVVVAKLDRRRNVEIHRRLSGAVAGALAS